MTRFAWLLIFVAMVVAVAPASAQPQVGWQAELDGHFHGVSGTITVVDENTLRVDDFVYDGQGIDVYFYLGTENSKAAFTAGLSIGPQLLGGTFTGNEEPMLIDLPAEQTIDGWNAISVWCVDVSISFGDAVFEAVTSPLVGDFNNDGIVDAADYTVWRDTLNQTGPELAADADGNEVVNQLDYDLWAANFDSATPLAIPEPNAIALLLAALVSVAASLRRA